MYWKNPAGTAVPDAMVGMTVTPFPAAWKGTRGVLHSYVRAAGSLARDHAAPEPFWGHRGLRVGTDGLAAAPVPLGDGRDAVVRLDLAGGVAALVVGESEVRWRLEETAPAALAAGLAAEASRHGVTAAIPEGLGGDTLAGLLGDAATFWSILRSASDALDAAAAPLPGWAAPQRFWPHGFDLSLVWFGGEGPPTGAAADAASRITIGFDPTTEPYFYANPWPFHARYTECTLPEGASWHTAGWHGTILPHEGATAASLTGLVAAVHGVM